MKLALALLCIALASPSFLSAQPSANAQIKGTVTDVTDARVTKAEVTFEGSGQRFRTQTGADGTYSFWLQPGTYTIAVRHPGFCTTRRAAFLVREHSEIKFDFQLWVCAADMGDFAHYSEFDHVPHTHLKPVILFGESHREGDLEQFSGPDFDDGLGHQRKYPVVFSFNLLTVQAEKISYNPRKHIVTANGAVTWRSGADAGTGTKLEIKLDGLEPHPQSSFVD
jgi:hypothetical protein